MIEIEELSCPQCKMWFGSHIMSTESRLGPPTMTCASCRHVVRSDWMEWADFSVSEKCGYFLRSVLYTAVLGFFTIFACLMAAAVLHATLAGWIYGSAFLLGTTFAIFMQVIRVVWSIRRRREKVKTVYVFYMSPHTNLQFLCIFAMGGVFALAWICGALLR